MIFLIIWFYGAFLPPTAKFPVTHVRDGIEITLLSERTLRLRTLDSSELASVLDLRHIETNGKIGPLISVDGWNAHPAHALREIPKGSAAEFHFRTFPPKWARSYDLRVTVSPWGKPVVSIPINLQKFPTARLSESAAGYKLDVDGVHWGRTITSSPSEKCLFATIAYSGFSYNGFSNREVRVVDNLGNVVASPIANSSNSGERTSLTLELTGLNRKATSLSFQLLSEADTDRLETVFTFERVPIGED
ncbi:MAG: hypothetical protein ABL949_13440 [Fimbriimonadaceae bacterium]